MRLYSDFWGARAYQIAGDVVALLVVIAGILLGRSLHDAIAGLEDVGTQVERSGSDFSSTLGSIGKQLGGVPLIGGGIRAPFDAASGAGATLASAGAQWRDGVERVATLSGWAVVLGVLLVVLVGWVRPRLVGAVRRAVVARLAGSDADLELLALRALATRPPRAVTRVDPHATAAWRRGDPDVIRRLAALELRAAGVRLREREGVARP
ncbi:hypothetical protein QDR37_10160 [Amnibacterium sp. CER49]|uniref:hypothetical protein n=1 Tax=Amnibacterium sp. CER49 TaxID=3039161 RepID=UPI00244848F9|nr:hypothetical protein [Amnibacterium sp. CER49]MDH2444304.1 hypothetical protein [Amnibacterium sp. CER49]